jgi:hypothetical protein
MPEQPECQEGNQQNYRPYEVQAHAARFDGMSELSWPAIERLIALKTRAMERAGTMLSRDYMARLERLSPDEWSRTSGNTQSTVGEQVGEAYFGPVGRWLQNRKIAVHDISVDGHCERVCIDFVQGADRERFLAAHPN